MATFGLPSSTDVFIPSANLSSDLSASLVVNYSRKVGDFKLNDYVKLTPVTKRLGYYKRILPYQSARVTSTGNEFLWNPGQDRPLAHYNKLPFTNLSYETKRYLFPTVLEYLEKDQADFPIQEVHLAMVAQQAMTNRVQQVWTKLKDTGNYLSGFNTTATALGGGAWDAATINDRYIQNSLAQAWFLINKATVGAVKYDDLTLIVNPKVANAMAKTQEFAAFVAQQAGSPDFLAGDAYRGSRDWHMLPSRIYGMKLIVEDTVAFTDESPTLTDDGQTGSYVVDDAAYILARPGQIEGMEGATDFSSVHIFSYEELAVESYDDPKNRRLEMGVVDDLGVEIVGQPALVRLTGVLT